MKLIESGIVTDASKDDLPLTEAYKQFGGDGVLVIPSNQTSFTINYTITQPVADGTPNIFNYTYNLDGDWTMAKKYVYNITMTLSEILIEPSVTPWGDAIETTPNLDGIGDDEKK
jgi:hypothetical protein